MVLSAFTVAAPCAGAVASVTTAGWSGTESFRSTGMVTRVSSGVVAESPAATGRPLSGSWTVTVTVAVLVWPSVSVTS